MAVDYDELLKEMTIDEARLMNELNELRAAKPLIERKQREAAQRVIQAAPSAALINRGRFGGMGATKAIPILLEGKPFALTSREVMEELKTGGWTSAAKDYLATVSATLSNLGGSGILDKVGDGWKLRNAARDYQEDVMNEVRDLTNQEIPDDVRETTTAFSIDWQRLS